MSDGSLYFGSNLVTDAYAVKDILWRTDNMGLDAYLITEGGKLLYLYLSDETMWEYAGTVRAEDYQEMEYR